jgi:hypothetical protein
MKNQSLQKCDESRGIECVNFGDNKYICSLIQNYD